MEGWIKLHRKLLNNPILQNPDLLQMFVYCLLRANHKPNRFLWGKEEITVERGQFVTGRFELAKDLNITPSSAYRRLKKLETLQFSNITSNNKYTLVTIVNYGLYQSEAEEANIMSNNKRTTNEHKQECKNEKNDKKELKDTLYPLQDTVDLFNRICISLPKVRTLTDTRKKTLISWFKTGITLEQITEVFDKTNASDFLSGRNKKWTACGFDWVIAPKNRIKILEGNYDNIKDSKDGVGNKIDNMSWEKFKKEGKF